MLLTVRDDKKKLNLKCGAHARCSTKCHNESSSNSCINASSLLTTCVQMTKNSEESNDEETKNNIDDAYTLAKDFFDQGKFSKALVLTAKTISDHGKNEFCYLHHELQGVIFFELAGETDITNIKCVYLFASLDAFSMSTLLCPDALRSFRGCVHSLIQLGHQLGINKFYEKAVSKANQGLSVKEPQEASLILNCFANVRKELEGWSKCATWNMSDAAVTDSETITNTNQMVSIKKQQSKANKMALIMKDPSFDRLKNFWVNLDDKTKREFLVVDFGKLIDYIQRKYGTKVKEHFQKCVPVANNLPWKCWKCHICSQVNYCFTDCKMHILDNHVHKFKRKLSSSPKCVDMVLADMICCGRWEPVDTAAATNLIKDRIKCGEEFVYVNGWCSDWPVAKDTERENILKQLAEVLKSSCPYENNTLSCTLWAWLIGYTEENLELPPDHRSYLDRCSFFKNPQCICFLDLKHLEHVLKYFTQLTTDVHASLVLNVVNEFWENSVVKERINLEGVTTYTLLLDEILLYDGDQLDKIGTVANLKSTGIYEDVKPQGDKIVSWVLDCPKIDKKFVSQMAKGVLNREIWLAALRIVWCMVRKKVSYYDKRQKMLTYEKMLGEVEAICDREDRRKNANQQRRYALMLQMQCEEDVANQDDDTKCFLNVVRDVLEKQQSPRFEVLEDMECISKLSTTVQNDVVKASLLRLRNSLKEKLCLIDSKILVKESMYKKLIDEFPKLSAVEYRLVVLPFVKKFLQSKLNKMMKTNENPTSASDEREPKKRHL